MALTTNVAYIFPDKMTYVRNGMSIDASGEGVQFPLQVGVPVQNNYLFKVIPASYSLTCVSGMNDYQAGGQPLNQTNTGSGNNIISTALNSKNLPNYRLPATGVLLDCERCISLTVYYGSAISTFTAYIEGFDYRGNAISFSATYSGSMTTVVILQPISIVTSVRFSNDFDASGSGTAQQMSVGNSNVIGLPYYLAKNDYVINATWAGTALAKSTITPGFNWRAAGTSGWPTRGYVSIPSTANGTSLLTCLYSVTGSDYELNQEIDIENQSSLKIAQIQKSTGPLAQNVLPYLTEYDLTGVVSPANNDFIYQYNLAKSF